MLCSVITNVENSTIFVETVIFYEKEKHLLDLLVRTVTFDQFNVLNKSIHFLKNLTQFKLLK